MSAFSQLDDPGGKMIARVDGKRQQGPHSFDFTAYPTASSTFIRQIPTTSFITVSTSTSGLKHYSNSSTTSTISHGVLSSTWLASSNVTNLTATADITSPWTNPIIIPTRLRPETAFPFFLTDDPTAAGIPPKETSVGVPGLVPAAEHPGSHSTRLPQSTQYEAPSSTVIADVPSVEYPVLMPLTGFAGIQYKGAPSTSDASSPRPATSLEASVPSYSGTQNKPLPANPGPPQPIAQGDSAGQPGQTTHSGAARPPSPNGGTQVLAEVTSGAANPTPAPTTLEYLLGGQTLSPGGPAITVSGTMLSLLPGGSSIVVDGSTRPVTAVLGTPMITPAEGMSGSETLKLAPVVTAEEEYVFGSQTLKPGLAVTVHGTTMSLLPGGSSVVIQGPQGTSTVSVAALASDGARSTFVTETFWTGGVSEVVVAASPSVSESATKTGAGGLLGPTHKSQGRSWKFDGRKGLLRTSIILGCWLLAS